MDNLTVQNCQTCKKPAGFYCHGCNKNFCQQHATEHRQSLYDQLDWLTVDHDDLVHTLDHTSSIKEINYQSRKLIDKWEEESIKHIRKTANEARQALFDALKFHIDDVKEKLKLLAEKINNVSHDHSILFDERNLKQWATELHTLKHEFLTTPSFTVRVHGNKPVVMPIIKIQPDPTYETILPELPQTLVGLIPIISSDIKKEKSIDQKDDRFYSSTEHTRILDNGQMIVHDSTKDDASIRGLQEYSQGRHQLFFRIEHMTTDQWIFFGIISKQGSFSQRAYMNSSAYGWTGYNSVYIKGKSKPISNGYLNDMKINDFIELTIDCDKKTIGLWHSRQEYKTKLPIDIQICPFPWQFLISCHNPLDSVRILPSSMGVMIKQEQDKLNNNMKIKEMEIKNENNNISLQLDNNTTETIR